MSGARGTIRKMFDIPATAITSNGSYDGSGSPTTVWNTGILLPSGTGTGGQTALWPTNIAEGPNDNNRIGLSVAAESLDLRVRITPDNTVAGYQHIRMILYADNECDGVFPTVAELLGDTLNSATTIATGVDMAFLQPGYLGRFHVLEDQNWVLYNSSTANAFTEQHGTPKSLYHEVHKDLHGHRIQWDIGTVGIGGARKGHIFLMFLYSINDTAIGGIPQMTSANPPTIHVASRLRYRDA